ncbi:bifunctional UDP-N-acetylglucosamine diphosphorylase/glucosamine-1-phosphate N-acetyltransferase GlmU [Kangiella sp. HZ709]|uniref:bifunctional UDP-N-acetylglucosamine diphosphorylase/glucosamine-1-phosphate N-acetyltransferase GlmU n=1 Tax=Kangiella sp. HZ709 TaxID=2666328 RepID=UPI0012AFE348|nr:bifunctional UDP-N-acetylglucosamine diphosphorylase/glucosamine-1-phosphate N-acetyltransferase GlmU [Kangiella sp. HZ709]MRX27935.1 UDP-N-acetylglucosamine diphosphorylase/glucosamine-1-phosphate N-acetyltransferase [Kangiella sp. HZ709]
MALSVVILAAGKGTRMKSSMPKVLHPIASKPMLQHVIDAANKLNAEQIIVVAGHGIDQVRELLKDQKVQIAEQAQQLGTGHAVDQAMPLVNKENQVLVLYGDVPLIKQETLTALCDQIPNNGISLLTVKLSNPTGYGRIVRDNQNSVVAIIEQKDASQDQLLINEVNTGILAGSASDLTAWLNEVDNNNAQGEYYLTDTIAMAAAKGGVNACHPSSEIEVEGVNSRVQLAALERAYQQEKAMRLMDKGVTLIDPSRLDIRGNLQCAQDVLIDINVIVEGDVIIETGAQIDANVILKDCVIGTGSHIKANTMIEGAKIGNNCQLGPFARVRPGTELADEAFIGNFVETKKTKLGAGSKASHLAYIGDAQVGEKVNIGAGVITCNYDGINKFQTIIEDGAFIGSDSQLVAPVTIGQMATVGAGTTVTKDVPAESLVISRVKQKHLEDWQRPVKQDKNEDKK